MKRIIGCDEAPHRFAKAGAKRGKQAARQDTFIKPRLLIGVDEAGRGAWAGPLVAAAVCLKSRRKFDYPLIRDSKKLSARQREEVFDYLQHNCEIGVAIVDAKEINTVGLQRANVLAVERAVYSLLSDYSGATMNYKIFIDYIGGFKTYTTLKNNYALHKFGETKYKEIAAASIIAKVTRDRLMSALVNQFPDYKFDVHKGYGTAQHKQALSVFGVSDIHRIQYRPIQAIIKPA